MTSPKSLSILLVVITISGFSHAAEKPKLTLDEFFNVVSFSAVEVSPDGKAVVIGTERADWDQSIFRDDLWLYRVNGQGGSLTQLTTSGLDSEPRWSPDGNWIAFLSERKAQATPASEGADDEISQLYIIPVAGGEAIPVSEGEEEVHAFAWSADSSALYFATRQPWTKEQKDAYKKEWKDVSAYRESERGDRIFKIELSKAVSHHTRSGSVASEHPERRPVTTPEAQVLTDLPLRVEEMVTSPDGRRLAFVTTSISKRWENVGEFEIYGMDLAADQHTPRQITHNEGLEQHLHWANDNKHVLFLTVVGSMEGKYRDTQPHLYWVDFDSGELQRWAPAFGGDVTRYSVARDGSVLATGRLGTEAQVYTNAKLGSPFTMQKGWDGTYEWLATSPQGSSIAFVHSTLEKPTEVYFADSIDKLKEAHPITSFNELMNERAQPRGKPYRWTAEDGTVVEGMLVYPPGKFEAKSLPTFVLIHGGPADADGNHFEADWYQWDRLAATAGWLVFEPNYRGSSGYGDKFLAEIVPQIVSRPGKDILEGVDALVKDGIADPDHLAVGGYSYGGYMTNWLITQTTRFKAAVTGAGAVEHVANWGNDDTTFDDAYFLGGLPWEAQQRYQSEAAINQIGKVRTPTHMVGGGADIRVAVLENYLLEHALRSLGVPCSLLIFPGEGHSLDNNPWHGKIKVREELKWLQKYGGVN